MKAQLCPVCGGSGKYPRLTNSDLFGPPKIIVKLEDQKECHGCNGRGWISLSEDSPHPIFFPKDKIRRQRELPFPYKKWDQKVISSP